MCAEALTDRSVVRRLLEALEVRPSQRLGQNFLVNPGIVNAIAEAVTARRPTRLVEIGPGLGAVTEGLAQLRIPLTAVEIDPRLAEHLEERHAQDPHVEIRKEDFLTYDLTEEAAGEPVMVVGSIPYRISAPILRHLVEHRASISEAILLTQREVAEKIAASPGPQGTALGVYVRAYADVKTLRRVGGGSFYPPPKVDSVLWSMTFREGPAFSTDEEAFFSVCRAVYDARRKMLRRVLRSLLPPERIDEALKSAGLEGTERGESLGFAELDRLSAAVKRLGG